MPVVVALPGPDLDRPDDSELSAANRERPVRWVGKYRILSELGRGGMANVYLAVARGPGGVNKLVVLKALLPELASEPGALAMFLDEARLAAQLNHANVVQTYEVGTEGERQVIVMEYLEGQSLAQITKRLESAGQSISPGMYLRIVISALEGLHYAHELSAYEGSPLLLVHRDVSPQNIFVTYGGQVKVLDFGIAKAASSSTHTATGIVKGKIAYMAPEQMVGENVDRRADVYSVGCMLWAVATGRKLWKDTPDVHIMRRVINGEIPTPQSVNAACDDELNRIVMKALAAEREQRYQTALELQEALEAYSERGSSPVKQKEIGNFVSALFADTRSELKALVERQLSLASNEEFVGTGDISSRSEVRTSQSRSGQSALVDIGQRDTTDGLAQDRSKTRIAWAVGALLLLGAVLFFMRPRHEERDAHASKANETAAMAMEPAPAPVAQAPAMVTLQLRADPPDATLFLDDETLPSNPTSKVLAVNGTIHRLRAEAPGYATRVAEFAPVKDGTVELSLIKADGAPQPQASAAHTPKYVHRVPTHGTTPVVSSKPTAAPAAKPACAQPFFLDTDGIKKIRPECM